MSTSRTNQLLVLHSLYDLARRDVPATAVTVARETALPIGVVLRCLALLDRAELVDRERTRLTLHGLTVALTTRAAVRLRSVLPTAA